jgi:hypothetical protein
MCISRVIEYRMMMMGGSCSMHGRKNKCTHDFGLKIRRNETTWKT